jgi:hypothetical protein
MRPYQVACRVLIHDFIAIANSTAYRGDAPLTHQGVLGPRHRCSPSHVPCAKKRIPLPLSAEIFMLWHFPI